MKQSPLIANCQPAFCGAPRPLVRSATAALRCSGHPLPLGGQYVVCPGRQGGAEVSTVAGRRSGRHNSVDSLWFDHYTKIGR